MKFELRNGSHAIRELPSQVLGVATVSKIPQTINSAVLIPMATALSTDAVSCVYEGEGDGDKATGEVWATNDVLYWDNTAKKFTKTSTSNTLCGRAGKPALTGDTRGYVIFKSYP